MNFADANILDVVAEGDAAILVGRIDRIRERNDQSEDVIVGALDLAVTHVLTPHRWLGPAQIEIGFAQYRDPRLRAHEGGQGWNGVEPVPGSHVLLAVHPIREGDGPRMRTTAPVTALSVMPLDSTEDPSIAAMERVLEIEATKDTNKRAAMLRQHLTSESDLLSGYCHYALGRLGRIPRETSVALEQQVLQDDSAPLQSRLDAQATLELELWRNDSPDDPVNRQILEAFFSALTATEPALQRPVVLAIYSLLVDDAPEDEAAARAYRDKLVEGIKWPPKHRLFAGLDALKPDPDLATEVAWVQRFVAQQ